MGPIGHQLAVKKIGADNEARTRYLNLGKVALSQMSYVRRPGAENEARTRDPNLGKVVLYH